MILGSLLVDIITISISAHNGAIFTIVLIPLIEMGLKVGIIVLCALDYFKNKDLNKGYSDEDRHRSMQYQ